MPSVDELLADVSSETNAIAACDKGLSAIGAFIDDILIKLETGAIDEAKAAVRDLQSLNTGLVTAIPAAVIPESAGAVGRSRAEQALATAEATVREHMGKLAEILQGVANAGEHVRASAQAIAEGKALS
jgi:hypothetical protein